MGRERRSLYDRDRGDSPQRAELPNRFFVHGIALSTGDVSPEVERHIEDGGKRLEAAQSKFEVGMATNFEVVQAQRDLADSRSLELRNILNYRKAIVDFQRSQLAGTSRTVTAIR